jgi:hypothetical protein
MDIIKNKVFFHIQRLNQVVEKEWHKNGNYQIGKIYNNFYKDIINGLENQNVDIKGSERLIHGICILLQSVNNDERDINKLKGNLIKLQCVLQNTKISFRQYLKWIQEEIFERVRLNKFPEFPSRQRCLWISNSEDLSEWVKIFNTISKNKILRISATGVVHKADAKLIDADTYFLSEFEKRAEVYWSGLIQNNGEIEYLFQGDLVVLEEYDNINLIKN